MSSGSATAATPQVWTFDNCIDWATANSTSVRKSILNIQQADQVILSAKDQWLPSVGFSTTHSYNLKPFLAQGGKTNAYNSAYDFSVNWTAWEGNARKYRLKSAELLKRQQEYAGEEAIVTIKLSILQAYLNILYAREAVVIAEQTLEVSTAQTKRAKRLMESGRTSKVDYAQIESQQAQDTYNLVQSKNNLETAKLDLKKILELRIDQDLNVADITFPDSEVLAALPDSLEVYRIAAGWLPGIQSNELNKDIYANDVKIAKAGSLPTITLNGGLGSGYTTGGSAWGTQMKNNFGPNVGIGISIPIFDANNTKRAVAKAKLAELDYDIERKTLLDDLSQTIENLYVESSNARARYSAGLAQLNSALLTDELTTRQFELGLVNPLELLTAHNNLLSARLELLLSKYMAILAAKTITYYATQTVSLLDII